MDERLLVLALGAMATAISALWFKMNTIRDKLDVLIHDEADCRGKLDAQAVNLEDLRASLNNKHAENIALLRRLECNVESASKHGGVKT